MRDEEERGLTMADHKTHEKHEHTHGPTCEHKAIEHEGHKDYLHDGHLHHLHEGHVDEHVLAAGKTNPTACTPSHTCAAHEKSHVHGGKCGHDAVPHGEHVDYLVGAHLHHPHGAHCDDHGSVIAA
jgi:hypothetical protein